MFRLALLPTLAAALTFAGCLTEETRLTGPDGSTLCGSAGDCPEALPLCSTDGVCVECNSDTDCSTDLCGPGGRCVACREDADCTDPVASRCDPITSECTGCEVDADCDGLPGGPGTCEGGTCVQCTPGTEADDCDGKACDPATLTCTATDLGSLEPCDPCLSDTECPTDHRCIPMQYQGTDLEAAYCLEIAGSCENPFRIIVNGRESLSGAPATESYCGINEELTTCDAVRALLDDARCPGGTNEECPQPSGLCRTFEGSDTNQCTYECGNPNQCDDPTDNPAGSTCGNGTTDGVDFCGG